MLDQIPHFFINFAPIFDCVRLAPTVGDKIKFPLCTDSPPTCERSCQQKSPNSRLKVARLYSDFRCTLNPGKKLSAHVFSSDPSREHAQTEQEEGAIILIGAHYIIVYLHSTVACRCLFSSLPLPLGAPVSYFHFRGFFGLVVLRER